MTTKLKVLTSNTHRITSKRSIENFLDLLRDIKPTVAYIQEICVRMAVQILGPYYQIYINMFIIKSWALLITCSLVVLEIQKRLYPNLE